MKTLSPMQFCTILVNQPSMVPIRRYNPLDLTKKDEVIQALKTVYSAYFAEDKQDGSAFDIFILESLDNILKVHRKQQGVA